MIEEEIARRYKDQEMRCPVHLSIGQEMNAVAIAGTLETTDYMVSTHRSHAHYLAKGGHIDGLIGELYGKSLGCSRGNGGSMHLTDLSKGFIASTSIVGGTIPIGVGCAFSAKLKGSNSVSVVCIGDAAIEEGVFHESANFASLHKLPVIFFMENNNYSCFTPRHDRQPKRENGFKDVATAHGMNFLQLRWDNFTEDYVKLSFAIRAMRASQIKTPIFVEADAYRFVEHCGPSSDDNLGYRPESEVARFRALDPLKTIQQDLLYSGAISKEAIEDLEYTIQREINESFIRVQAAMGPGASELGAYLYA